MSGTPAVCASILELFASSCAAGTSCECQRRDTVSGKITHSAYNAFINITFRVPYRTVRAVEVQTSESVCDPWDQVRGIVLREKKYSQPSQLAQSLVPKDIPGVHPAARSSLIVPTWLKAAALCIGDGMIGKSKPSRWPRGLWIRAVSTNFLINAVLFVLMALWRRRPLRSFDASRSSRTWY